MFGDSVSDVEGGCIRRVHANVIPAFVAVHQFLRDASNAAMGNVALADLASPSYSIRRRTEQRTPVRHLIDYAQSPEYVRRGDRTIYRAASPEYDTRSGRVTDFPSIARRRER